jgi:hypothetical protein
VVCISQSLTSNILLVWLYVCMYVCMYVLNKLRKSVSHVMTYDILLVVVQDVMLILTQIDCELVVLEERILNYMRI